MAAMSGTSSLTLTGWGVPRHGRMDVERALPTAVVAIERHGTINDVYGRHIVGTYCTRERDDAAHTAILVTYLQASTGDNPPIGIYLTQR